MSIANLATKSELKKGLMAWFEVNEDIGDMYVTEAMKVSEDTRFILEEMDKVDEWYVDKMIEYIYKYHVGKV